MPLARVAIAKTVLMNFDTTMPSNARVVKDRWLSLAEVGMSELPRLFVAVVNSFWPCSDAMNMNDCKQYREKLNELYE